MRRKSLKTMYKFGDGDFHVLGRNELHKGQNTKGYIGLFNEHNELCCSQPIEVVQLGTTIYNCDNMLFKGSAQNASNGRGYTHMTCGKDWSGTLEDRIVTEYLRTQQQNELSERNNICSDFNSKYLDLPMEKMYLIKEIINS